MITVIFGTQYGDWIPMQNVSIVFAISITKDGWLNKILFFIANKNVQFHGDSATDKFCLEIGQIDVEI